MTKGPETVAQRAGPGEQGRTERVLVAWYAASVGSLALVPWMALLLTDAGFSPSTASLLLLGYPIARMFGGPFWAFLADRWRPEPILRGGALLGLVGLGVVLLAEEPAVIAAGVIVWALSRSPLFPIVDATTVALVGRRYGRIRSVGSVGFLVAGALGGVLRDRWPATPVLLGLALTGAGAWFTFRLPPLVASPGAPALRDLGRLVRDPTLAVFAIAATLHGAGLAVYDHLYAVRIDALGLPSWVVGLSITSAVAVEVALMLRSDELMRRLRPEALLVVSMAAGVPRLLLTGATEHPLALVLLQGLHGLHFGAFWLASTALLAERAAPQLRHTTQALLPSAAFGAGPILGLALASRVLEEGSAASTGAVFQLAATLAAAATVIGAAWLRGARRED